MARRKKQSEQGNEYGYYRQDDYYTARPGNARYYNQRGYEQYSGASRAADCACIIPGKLWQFNRFRKISAGYTVHKSWGSLLRSGKRNGIIIRILP